MPAAVGRARTTEEELFNPARSFSNAQAYFRDSVESSQGERAAILSLSWKRGKENVK